MRMHSAALGDFVPGAFAVPQNPVVVNPGHFGLGEFVRASFGLPQRGGIGYYPGRLSANDEWCQGRGWKYYNTLIDECEWNGDEGPIGLSGIGCGCGGGCGGRCGMGAVDLSLTGTGIVSSLGTSLGMTSLPAIPNWAVYGIGGLLAYMAFAGGKRRRGR